MFFLPFFMIIFYNIIIGFILITSWFDVLIVWWKIWSKYQQTPHFHTIKWNVQLSTCRLKKTCSSCGKGFKIYIYKFVYMFDILFIKQKNLFVFFLFFIFFLFFFKSIKLNFKNGKRLIQKSKVQILKSVNIQKKKNFLFQKWKFNFSKLEIFLKSTKFKIQKWKKIFKTEKKNSQNWKLHLKTEKKNYKCNLLIIVSTKFNSKE